MKVSGILYFIAVTDCETTKHFHTCHYSVSHILCNIILPPKRRIPQEISCRAHLLGGKWKLLEVQVKESLIIGGDRKRGEAACRERAEVQPHDRVPLHGRDVGVTAQDRALTRQRHLLQGANGTPAMRFHAEGRHHILRVIPSNHVQPVRGA